MWTRDSRIAKRHRDFRAITHLVVGIPFWRGELFFRKSGAVSATAAVCSTSTGWAGKSWLTRAGQRSWPPLPVEGALWPGKGLSSFCRAGFSPQPGSSSSLYADAGLVYTRLIPSRDADKLGIAFAYSKVGSLTAAETASAGYPGSFEAVAELSYSLQFSQAVSIQPDLQYILHPGGTQQYGNALVLGVRAVVNF